MMKINVGQRELIFSVNKAVKNKKILNTSIGKNDDYINKRNTLNYNNIVKIRYETYEINKEIKIFDIIFVKKNKNKVKTILNNKQYNLMTKIENINFGQKLNS